MVGDGVAVATACPPRAPSMPGPPGSATWERVQETNLRGPYLLSRRLAPALGADGGGRIVNIASAGGLFPGSSSIAYSCSKAGLIHLTHCLAVALSPDVSVNCV